LGGESPKKPYWSMVNERKGGFGIARYPRQAHQELPWENRYSSSLKLPRKPSIHWRHPSEGIPVRSVEAETGNDFVNRAPFDKRANYRAILKKLKIPVYPKSGEFRNKGTIRRFPGPYRPRTRFFHAGERNPG